MAYKIIERVARCITEQEPYYRDTIVMDSADDLEAVGTNHAVGSVAIVADVGTPTYMLNASKVWKEV